MLDWVIIGGGIHGVHMAVRLIAEAGVVPERLLIVDPAERLLDSWLRCTSNTGMRFLRSPAVHHLDLDPYALLRFAGKARKRFARPYNRPAVDLFAEHCDHVLDKYGLRARHCAARVAEVELDCDSARVRLDDGDELSARNVVLAMGSADAPRWPEWAAELRSQGADVQHVFESGIMLDPARSPRRVAVVGGGISAAQVALRLSDAGRQVHMISRHAARVHQFDSDPGWMGPKNLRGFQRVGDLGKRRELITQARHAGSMPAAVDKALRRAVSSQQLELHLGEVTAATAGPELTLMLADAAIVVDAVVLATGFSGERPGGPLIDKLIADHSLPCASCGYPVVDAHLRWHPRLFVTGPLAELRVGPVSRNIAGARHAGVRILGALRG